MTEYKYINEYEREWTQKYEGTYTSEEIELNKKLKEECSKEAVDYTLDKIENLTNQDDNVDIDKLHDDVMAEFDKLKENKRNKNKNILPKKVR